MYLRHELMFKNQASHGFAVKNVDGDVPHVYVRPAGTQLLSSTD